ncbi:hypothetical protein GWI33_010090 [Rhynchophorus ferrugineus]|uniref:RNA polymerase sigma factor n=1 Tax=Rhynchophorus ferrugineus TaxID=354439 RepID=A0A834MAD0_RHYFE|nr:hypothetical protein GWI33_010090 [Rhynchophorus ferrugineus]
MSHLSVTPLDDLMVFYDDLVDYITQKVGNRQIAQETVQETYLRALQKPEQFHSLNSPIAYLKKVSLNIALDYVRKQQTQHKYVEVIESIDIEQDEVFELYTEQEFILLKQQYGKLILEKIKHLPPMCQDVFLLVQFHGMSQVEVAEQLGISRMMVAKHLVRALQSFSPMFNQAKFE